MHGILWSIAWSTAAVDRRPPPPEERNREANPGVSGIFHSVPIPSQCNTRLALSILPVAILPYCTPQTGPDVP